MAYISLNRNSLAHNYNYLDSLFKKHDIEWAPVVKLLCGNQLFLQEVMQLGKEQLCDSRISNLKQIKKIDPKRQTIYIKPPPKSSVESVVRYADVSFNTETQTIEMLNDEAKRQNKVHRIIIMIELGDLREGIMHDHLHEFYSKVVSLSNIKIMGIGANLNCLNGVMPSRDKMIQLSLYKQLIEVKFNTQIKAISGGSSVTLPLLIKNQIPKVVNHFRIGETLFNGLNLVSGKKMKNMKDDVLLLHAEIIEITEKPAVPYGELGETPSGEVRHFDEQDGDLVQKRAILDIGLLDVGSTQFLEVLTPKVEIIDGSSDMVVVDITKAKNNLSIGSYIIFRLQYMGALRVMNSDYIGKNIV
jgi:ornithine racemase